MEPCVGEELQTDKNSVVNNVENSPETHSSQQHIQTDSASNPGKTKPDEAELQSAPGDQDPRLTADDCRHNLNDLTLESTPECSHEDQYGNTHSNETFDFEAEEYFLTLNTLPTEILLHICSYLKAKFVIHTLSQVCQSFNDLFGDNTFWKIRIGKRWPKRYPAIPVNDEEFNWKEACIQREEQHRQWSDPTKNMMHFTYNEGLFAAVDSVHLMKNASLLAAGSRDRYLSLVDLTKLDPDENDSIKEAKIFSKMDAHKGWIWSVTSQDNTLATGSWDTYIKFWDLAAGGEEIQKIKCKSAVLSCHFEAGYFLAGSYDRKVYHIDPRTGSILAEKKYHGQPVLCMAVDDNYVVTGSEDKTVVIYDRRADEVFKTIQLEAFPMSMSYGMDQLWVGDKKGFIHLFDATDGDFNFIETYDIGHKGKVTGILHNLGSIFTCSTDKTIKVLEPNLNPAVINTLSQHKLELGDIDFQNETLVYGCCDASIGIWKPRPNVD